MRLALLLIIGLVVGPVAGARGETLTSGNYAFSDELGGLRLVSVTGTGSADDPIILVEEFFETGPAVLTIRRLDEQSSPAGPPISPSKLLYIEKLVINSSRRVWLGFELELEEIRGKASTFRDGLSFDQIAKQQDRVHADRFRHGERTFEPGDRLLFHGGAVNHGETLRLSVLVTDTSPTDPFYLVQTPQLPTAGLSGFSRRFAFAGHPAR